MVQAKVKVHVNRAESRVDARRVKARKSENFGQKLLREIQAAPDATLRSLCSLARVVVVPFREVGNRHRSVWRGRETTTVLISDKFPKGCLDF